MIAQRMEQTASAERYRQRYEDWLRRFTVAAGETYYRYQQEAILAALKGDNAQAIRLLGRAIDLGLRWDGWFDDPALDPLRDQLGFRAERDRIEALTEDDRAAVQRLLCDPSARTFDWNPTAASCAGWTPTQTTST